MKVLERPSQSLKMNYIELLLHDLKLPSVAERKQFWKEQWAIIPSERCERLFASYYKHLSADLPTKDSTID